MHSPPRLKTRRSLHWIIDLPKGEISLRNGHFEGKLTSIRSYVELPPFLGDFGIEVQPLLTLARIAGFRSIRIDSNTSERSETTFGLQGSVGSDHTLQGAISTATTYIPEASSDLLFDDEFDDGKYVPRGRMWGDLNITLNTREIQQQITDDDKAVNDKKAWSKHIQQAIVIEMLKKGTYNLLRSGDKRNELDAVLQGPFAYMVTSAFLHFLEFGTLVVPQIGVPVLILGSVWELFTGSYIIHWNSRRGNGPARFSLFGVHAPAIDRAVALFGASEVVMRRNIVKPILE